MFGHTSTKYMACFKSRFRSSPTSAYLMGRALMGRALVGRALMGRALVGQALMGRARLGPSWPYMAVPIYIFGRITSNQDY